MYLFSFNTFIFAVSSFHWSKASGEFPFLIVRGILIERSRWIIKNWGDRGGKFSNLLLTLLDSTVDMMHFGSGCCTFGSICETFSHETMLWLGVYHLSSAVRHFYWMKYEALWMIVLAIILGGTPAFLLFTTALSHASLFSVGESLFEWNFKRVKECYLMNYFCSVVCIALPVFFR